MIEIGILNINKPEGMTSNDVIYKVRRAVGIKKVGHTGTLDPMATGVLPVCIGSSARITEYLDMDFKEYVATMVLGKLTDTQDIWGEVIEERPVLGIDEEKIRDAFSGFKGFVEQFPPMYSAVRVNGKRLYDYARKGQTVQGEIKKRRIYIKELEILSIDLDKMEISFKVLCSKGTYIRTICQDVGMKLGTGAVMTKLIRTKSGAFDIKDAISIDELGNMSEEELKKRVLGTDFPLIHFGKVIVNRETAKRFIDGFHLSFKECRIISEPEFKDKDSIIPIDPRYKVAYNIYEETPVGEHFIGVATYSTRYKKLVADKVLSKGFNYDNI